MRVETARPEQFGNRRAETPPPWIAPTAATRFETVPILSPARCVGYQTTVCRVTQGPQHAGHVFHRRQLGAPVRNRTRRLTHRIPLGDRPSHSISLARLNLPKDRTNFGHAALTAAGSQTLPCMSRC